MKIADVPSKFNIPWADAAGSTYVNTIPEASQIGIKNGAASLHDGFPPLNFLPVGSGGVPPFGADFNGILRQITQWNQWQGAGGLTEFDSAFSTAIGGYPKGAIVLSASTAGLIFVSTVDDNTNDPDSDVTGWSPLAQAGSADVVSNGWWREPYSGFTVQWGQNNTSNGTVAVTFTRAFTTLFAITATDDGASSWSTTNASFIGIGGQTTAGFTAQSVTWNGSGMIRTGSNVYFGWHAFGIS